MVLGRNDKRKRKAGDLVDLMDPLSESPKKAKIHAQRKFAQGAATMFTSSPTFVKEKDKPKSTVVRELIPHKRPNPTDFLTFLCFRGTSILPPSLNFFNPSHTKKAKTETKTSPTRNSDRKSGSISTSTSTESPKKESNQSTVSKNKSTEPVKKKVANHNVQNKVNKYNSATSTVQALKKKYQEQRLAKQRIKNHMKTPCVIRTRSATERSMSSTIRKLAPKKFLPRVESKRHCLRSNSNNYIDNNNRNIYNNNSHHHSNTEKSRKVNSPKNKLPTKSKRKLTKEQSSESSESESESEEDNKSDIKPPHVLKKSIKTVKKITSPAKIEHRRVTRSRSDVSSNQSLSQRPTRKTKEAAAVYMEILSRKLVSPDLEADDNLSLDSYPELPNTRRNLENENKNKIKANGRVNKDLENKTSDKQKGEKNVIKNKKTMKESSESDGESVSSVESNRVRPITRRSSNTQIVKPAVRSLRSSSRNSPQKIKPPEATKPVQNNKTWVKRKRENKSSPTEKALKEKKPIKEENKNSEDDSLSNLTNKIKKIRESEESEESEIREKKFNKKDKIESLKISDDEGSFRGFTTKATMKARKKILYKSGFVPLTQLKLQKKELLSGEVFVESSSSRASPSDIDKKSLSIISSTITTPVNDNSNDLKTQNTISTETSSNEQFFKSNFSGTLISPIVLDDNDQRDSISSGNIPLGSLSSRPSLTESEKKCHFISNHNSNSLIVEIPPSTSLGRKERVSMTTEQIEKWLQESSIAMEEGGVEVELPSNYSYELPEKIKPDGNHLSIPTKIQHLVRPVNVAIAKIADKAISKDRMGSSTIISGTGIAIAKPTNLTNPIPTNRNKINADIKEIIKGRIAKASVIPNKETSTAEDSDVSSKADVTSIEGSPDKKTPEKKSNVQPRKTFVSKIKERKAAPSINAFSPENESSVYAFESDTEVPVSTPFRRKQRDKSSISGSDLDLSKSENDEKTLKIVYKPEKDEKEKISKSVGTSCNDEIESKKFINASTSFDSHQSNSYEVPENYRNKSNVQVLPLGKIPTVWNNVNCSASIAVQVNFEDQVQDNDKKEINEDGTLKSTEISTQTENTTENEDENDDHVFYIPLQAVARNGRNLVQGQPLIQGVEVKFGKKGPNGPNQRVLLRAQLVTKPPSAARCPPVGTVQPTTRTPPTITADPVPSTSTSTSTSTMSTSSTSNVLPVQSDIKTQNTEKIITSKQTSINTPLEKVSKSPKVSRERKSSIDGTKNNKKTQNKSKKVVDVITSIESTFPSMEVKGEARLVEAPTFHPSEKDFQDPLEYIEKIRPIAEKYGICKVVPPSNFKPECKVSDDMRFTAYNQYIHRMLHRWGPNVKEMMAIKKYLATQSITLNQPPWIGGMEVDLPHLYQTVQSLGGLKEVIEKKRWQKVADGMKIPKSAQDRVTKLDDIYCKYLLPYDTLSTGEREKLFDEVEEEWKKRESKALQRLNQTPSENEDDEDDDSDDDIEECIVKGRNMPLNAFYRIARNTQRMWFGENQSSANEAEGALAVDVESAFWKHVSERKRHVCVHAASIDSSGRGFGFSVAKNSPFARHPWNLKVLTNNAGSVLRALGPLMGVTVPTLHVGMLFSACCWYRDPHGLPWIEYLHTGAKKIWYGIPDEHNDNFREALSKMVPRFCKNKKIWLPSDTAMVPPEMLVSNGVPLCRTVQEPGQFIIVFPKAFTSSICTGYVVSESVYFAQTTWLEHAEQIFTDLQDSCEPSMFSFERLLFSIINDSRSHIDVLKQILPVVIKIRERELNYRQHLESYGLVNKEKLPLPGNAKRKKGQKVVEDEDDYECDNCRANLFVSLVTNSKDDSTWCLRHGLVMIAQKKQIIKNCILKYTYSEDELDELIHKLEDRIEAKSKRTNQSRQTRQ
ncbi:protein Jumonji [Chelonus insularis]|uniref:protein Jumonji n=1 Tax=Chelonus insularis TaxID=460826 RepID=UPI0015887409|nr:protein Jumonji [Chelonus insularis]XP_034941747.1 protein Jumonji [Chelonus insularis]